MMGMQTQIPEEVFVEKAIWDAVHRHLRSIFTRDVDTYQETTGEDLSLYEWFVTPHRLDGLEFHRFMIESNWSAVGERWRYDLLEPRLQRYGDAAIVSYTATGSTALRVSRERPMVPIMGLTPKVETARRLAIAWGVHCVPTHDPSGFNDMVDIAIEAALRDAFAQPNDRVVIIAGVPFGTPGATNLLHIAYIPPFAERRIKPRPLIAAAE